MLIELKLNAPRRRREFATVHLRSTELQQVIDLRLDADALRAIGPVTPITTDLLLLALVVYALDRAAKRVSAADAWTRTFEFTLPVSDVLVWERARELVERCLSFLSGDIWILTFEPGAIDLWYPDTEVRVPEVSAVCLFSGGLDSLVGAVNYLEESGNGRLWLVGHRDPTAKTGVMKEQRHLATALQTEYPGRVETLFPFAGASAAAERTLRSRSFLFLALAVLSASSQTPHTPVLIPENGTIALNPPLTPSRYGSLTTRTAHPHYLALFQLMLTALGIDTPVINPLANATKGEIVTGCRNGEFLYRTFAATNSCAKRGHTLHWVRRDAGQCGRCMPCIYRRAALHVGGLDVEAYGNDVCTGEVDPAGAGAASDDLRALCAFLRDQTTPDQVADRLFRAGRLDVERLPEYAALVLRTMAEVRTLLSDKAIAAVRHAAGLP